MRKSLFVFYRIKNDKIEYLSTANANSYDAWKANLSDAHKFVLCQEKANEMAKELECFCDVYSSI